MTGTDDDAQAGSRSNPGSSDPVELFKQEISRTFGASQLPAIDANVRADQPTTQVPDASSLGIVPAPWLSSTPTPQPAGTGGPTRMTGQRAAVFGAALVAVLVAAGLIAYLATSSGSTHTASPVADQTQSAPTTQSVAPSDPPQVDPSVASDAGIGSEQPDSDTPSTDPASESTDSTDDVVSALNGLLDDSTDARSGVQPALNNIQTCQADDTDIGALQNAANVRRTLITNLESLDFNDMSGGQTLHTALVRALTASINADDSYIDWGNDELGCTGSAGSDSGKRAGDRYSKAATAAKIAFLNLWNPLAENRGYQTRDQGDI